MASFFFVRKIRAQGADALAKAAGRIGGVGNRGAEAGAGGVWRHFGRGGLGDADAGVQREMLLRTARAEALAGVFIAQAGQLVAATNTITIACL